MSSSTLARLAGPAAVMGGLLWVAVVTGHTFAHGSTQSPRDAAVLGLQSLDFFRLLAIPPLLFALGLAGASPSGSNRGQVDRNDGAGRRVKRFRC